MSYKESNGYSSIKVIVKDGLTISEPEIHHMFPKDRSENSVDIPSIEKELKTGLKHLLSSKELPDGKVGFFMEYTSEDYKKAP